jgi:hypothetical protein
MRKMSKKLALHRETLRTLQDATLREVAGGVVTLRTCGNPCSAACSDVCTDACPTQGGSHCTQ